MSESSLERIIKKCLDLFENFETLKFDMHQNGRMLFPEPIDFIYQLEDECKIIERQLNGLYLMGQEDIVARVKEQLVGIRLGMKPFDIDLVFHVAFVAEPYDYTITSEMMNELINIQIDAIDNLIKKIERISQPTIKTLAVAQETTANKLKSQLEEYGFMELVNVAGKSDKAKTKLIEEIDKVEVPYKIALLKQSTFLTHLSQNYFPVKDDLYKFLAKVLEISERVVKGNVLVLSPKSKESRDRYTSYLHLQKADDFIRGLK